MGDGKKQCVFSSKRFARGKMIHPRGAHERLRSGGGLGGGDDLEPAAAHSRKNGANIVRGEKLRPFDKQYPGAAPQPREDRLGIERELRFPRKRLPFLNESRPRFQGDPLPEICGEGQTGRKHERRAE